MRRPHALLTNSFFLIGTLLLASCYFTVEDTGPQPAPQSGGDTCDSVDTSLEDLLASYVNVDTELDCNQPSDCTLVDTGGFCGPAVVNTTAAAGYQAYFASSRYHQLKSESDELCGPRPMNGMCANWGPATQPTCVSGRCTRTESDCSTITDALEVLLAKYVNTATQSNCAQSSDCTLIPGDGPCGYLIVNKTAAAGYASYRNDPQYQSLAQQERSACGFVAGTCVQQPSVFACQSGQCIAAQ